MSFVSLLSVFCLTRRYICPMDILARPLVPLLVVCLSLFLGACSQRGTDKVAHSNQWIGDSVLLYSTLTTPWERKDHMLAPSRLHRFNTTLRVYRTKAGSGQCATKQLVMEMDSILPCEALLYRAEDSLAYFSYLPLNDRGASLPLNSFPSACYYALTGDTLRLFAFKPWQESPGSIAGTLDTAALLANLKDASPYGLFEFSVDSGAICPPGCECIRP